MPLWTALLIQAAAGVVAIGVGCAVLWLVVRSR
jgi:hypothetical protein